MTRAAPHSEAAVTAAIRLELGLDPDVVLWRNTTGEAEHFADSGHATRQRFGLAVGSADFIGIVVCGVATHLGLAAIGRFLSLEVKRPRVTAAEARALGCRPQSAGTLSKDQRTWRDCVRRRGGVAVVVRSVDEARAVVERAKREPAWLGEGYDE